MALHQTEALPFLKPHSPRLHPHLQEFLNLVLAVATLLTDTKFFDICKSCGEYYYEEIELLFEHPAILNPEVWFTDDIVLHFERTTTD